MIDREIEKRNIREVDVKGKKERKKEGSRVHRTLDTRLPATWYAIERDTEITFSPRVRQTMIKNGALQADYCLQH